MVQIGGTRPSGADLPVTIQTRPVVSWKVLASSEHSDSHFEDCAGQNIMHLRLTIWNAVL